MEIGHGKVIFVPYCRFFWISFYIIPAIYLIPLPKITIKKSLALVIQLFLPSLNKRYLKKIPCIFSCFLLYVAQMLLLSEEPYRLSENQSPGLGVTSENWFVFSAGGGKHNPIIWNNMERIIES